MAVTGVASGAPASRARCSRRWRTGAQDSSGGSGAAERLPGRICAISVLMSRVACVSCSTRNGRPPASAGAVRAPRRRAVPPPSAGARRAPRRGGVAAPRARGSCPRRGRGRPRRAGSGRRVRWR
eukprot:2317855-Rhodomonas_salina.1